MTQRRISTGVAGLDRVMHGGWPAGRAYLVQGYPGTGKTTLGFQFLVDGAKRGETALYVTLSETRGEVEGVARAHDWPLDGIDIFDLDAAEGVLGLGGDAQSIFDPSDVEFRETSRAVLEQIERVSPVRVVFDSLSELALLARDPLSFRREILVLKRALMSAGATTLLLSDRTNDEADRQLHSLAHGVVDLEEQSPQYGPERRRLRVRKLRGSGYLGGYHDFGIVRGGIEVYPRLVAATHARRIAAAQLPTGLPELDELMGGGLVRGASTLLLGPAGAGKSVLLGLFAHAALVSGDRAALFLFDESTDSFLDRSAALGMPLRPYLDAGTLRIDQVDPAQLSPGQFLHAVRGAVEDDGVSFVGVDSLNGYVYSMPEERFLAAHTHELLSFLARRGVATVLVLTQSGLVGAMKSPADLTYIADAVLLLRFFEVAGEVRRAISMFKKRAGAHDRAIRELSFEDGVQVGEPLKGFQGVLTGVPRFVGPLGELMEPPDGPDGP